MIDGHLVDLAHQPVASLTVIVIFKIVALLVGFGFAYLGYRLFMSGIFFPSGDMDTKWKDLHIVMRQAAPGILFALFGAVIICVAMFTDFTL